MCVIAQQVYRQYAQLTRKRSEIPTRRPSHLRPGWLGRYQACPVWQWGHFTVVDTGATNTKPHSQL
jgi:hypothetical protein